MENVMMTGTERHHPKQQRRTCYSNEIKRKQAVPSMENVLQADESSHSCPTAIFRKIKDPRRGLLLLAYNHELESVVQFNAPCIRGIFRLAVICFRAEVVVSVQFYILLYSNTCFCCPELHACTLVPAIFQLIRHV